ncbi:SpoIIE family protein phosphatase [bacterium]|nr:SpoIIE family protein phosphatase [bacterium]
MHVLIADDDVDSRRLISKYLESWNHDVVTAMDGDEAMNVLLTESVDLVISDWMMPNVDGIELCRRIRSAGFDRYIYLILLTAKNAKHELVAGMEAGADDFISKPFNKDELKVRVRAGARMLELQKSLEQKNKNLEHAYSVIEKDLESAAELQRSFLPTHVSATGGVKFESVFLPCTFVAGDSFNFFKLDDRHIAFYLLDVAGHGIPAAMLSVTLSKMLVPSPTQTNEPQQLIGGVEDFYSPARQIETLNIKFQDEYDAMRYFTMIYGVIDTGQEIMRIAQAGHPSPLLLKRDGEVASIGQGGMPVGMLPDIYFDEYEFEFKTGDRLLAYSDGITECPNPEGEQFSEARLLHCVETHKDRTLGELLAGIKNSLHDWTKNQAFADDVSVLALEKTN